MSDGHRSPRSGHGLRLAALLAFLASSLALAGKPALANPDDAPPVEPPPPASAEPPANAEPPAGAEPPADAEPRVDLDEEDPGDPDTEADSEMVRLGEATDRISIDVTAGMFGRFPGGLGEAGAGIVLGTPFWMGTRWQFGQFEAIALALFASSTTGRLHGTAAVAVRAHLYLGSWFSMEMHMGPAFGGQTGPGGPGTATVGFSGGGGYVLHPFDDHRTRVKLVTSMWMLGGVRRDAGNDCPLCSGHLGMAIGYEQAF